MKNACFLLLLIGLISCKDPQEEPQPLPEIQQLTNHTENVYDAIISGDGTTIFYTIQKYLDNGDTHTELYSIKSDGSNQKKILTYPNLISTVPVVSANGNLLAFAATTYANSGNVNELFLVNADGTNLRKAITGNTAMYPYAFVDNDNSIVYGKSMLIDNCSCNTFWKANLNGSQNRRIGNLGVMAHITSDRKTLLLDDQMGNASIMDAEGNGHTRLASATPAKISPMGTSVILRKVVPVGNSTDPNGPHSFQVFSVKTDGTDFRQLTTSAFQNYPIDFFPDGRRILYTSMDYTQQDKMAELYSVTLDGTEVKRLTNNDFREHAIGFLEKKNKVLFTSNKDGKVNLYVLDLRE